MTPFDRPREACGVVGMYTLPERRVDVARVAYFGLYALQHRGQESAGIAVSDGRRSHVHRGMGLVSQVFTEAALADLAGHLAIGHNRYSTTGTSTLNNAQPYRIDTLHGPIAVGHNGNVTNAAALRRELLAHGVGLVSTSDSEVLTQMLARPAAGEAGAPDWPARFARLMGQVEGAYSLVVLTRDAVYVLRDPLGMRPLCLGEMLDEDGVVIGYVAASESAAFGTLGVRHLREIEPGEVVRLDRHGATSILKQPAKRQALCVFEYVYFARPDSVIDERLVYAARKDLGARLAEEHPVEADIVIPVPDSSMSAAVGYAEAAGIPFGEGLMKNRYIGRTFIQPTDQMRRDNIRLKFNPIRGNLAGKRVVLVDDSIVRGNTMGKLVELLRTGGGAREVHVRVASPPVRHPCFMGVDLATHAQLIAHRMSLQGIARHIGADSLGYLSIEGLKAAVQKGRPPGHCAACFDGAYPVDVSAFAKKSGPAAYAAPRRG